MRVLIAPDKFKGALSAEAAAHAIERGIRARCASAQVTLCPMADGGEGTVEALLSAVGGERRSEVVVGPLPEMRVAAGFALLRDGTAVIEMSAASGLALVPAEKRNPLRTTTYGTGQLLRAAADEGARRIILGIGGSATTDGGIGALQALGARLIMNDDTVLGRPAIGADLERLARIEPPADWELPELMIACDVTNPLCGPTGAAAVFGPQKGASPDEVELLDRALERLAREHGKVDLARSPGSGAAGGLGFGLSVFVPCVKMATGFELVAGACDFREKLRGADLCITAEGRLDRSTLGGKTASGVARYCRELGIRCIVLAGSVDGAAERQFAEQTGAMALPIADGPISLEEAMARTAELLERAATRVMRLVR